MWHRAKYFHITLKEKKKMAVIFFPKILKRIQYTSFKIDEKKMV